MTYQHQNCKVMPLFLYKMFAPLYHSVLKKACDPFRRKFFNLNIRNQKPIKILTKPKIRFFWLMIKPYAS